jgi:hypothetical protein
MDSTILPIESIQERDIDLLLLEELTTDNSFCEWFVRELNLPFLTQTNGAWRSISNFGLGETDILFSYKSVEKKIFILIENKLDSSFQFEQFLRYDRRAKEYIENKECDEAFSVLVAPNLYCENQNDFENFISYESISQRLIFTGTKRNLFKSELLKIATEKLRRGYQPINSELVQKFWYSYWNYKESKYPSLYMKKPGIVPHNSDWPILYDDKLKDVVFYHKLGQGNIDATFINFSDEIEFKIKENLPDDIEFVKHSKSFSLRIFSGKIDRTADFENQLQKIENGLQNIEKLRNWLIKVKSDWL